jgi:hypothetical protein
MATTAAGRIEPTQCRLFTAMAALRQQAACLQVEKGDEEWCHVAGLVTGAAPSRAMDCRLRRILRPGAQKILVISSCRRCKICYLVR